MQCGENRTGGRGTSRKGFVHSLGKGKVNPSGSGSTKGGGGYYDDYEMQKKQERGGGEKYLNGKKGKRGLARGVHESGTQEGRGLSGLRARGKNNCRGKKRGGELGQKKGLFSPRGGNLGWSFTGEKKKLERKQPKGFSRKIVAC